FTAAGGRGEGRRHFWRYYDIKRGRMLDNRFLITNLIACSPDTPRVVGDADVFAIQEKVIEDILGSVREQQAVEAAPKVLDPLQQTVITLLRGYLNSPAVKRSDVREAMQRLRQPMTHTSVRELRRAYERFQEDQRIIDLVGAIRTLVETAQGSEKGSASGVDTLSREDLHLVCFNFVWS
ncbi:MAG: helicase, partial [Chloroflexota bacterium]